MKTSPEALAILEIDGIARAAIAQDAALKRGRVTVLANAPTSPGKMLLVLCGPLAEVEESFAAAIDVCSSALFDRLLLPNVHPEVVTALATGEGAGAGAGLLVLELSMSVAAVRAADAARKAALVTIGRLHLGSGYGGRAYFTLHGEQVDLEAALAAVRGTASEHLRDAELIARPHEELLSGLLVRPWPLDPAALHRRSRSE